MQAGPTSPTTTPAVAAVVANASLPVRAPDARSPTDTLESAQREYAEARRQLERHERRYRPELQPAAFLFGGGMALQREFATQVSLRQSLEKAERLYAETASRESSLEGTAAAEGILPSAQAVRPATNCTQWPHEERISYLNLKQQAGFLAEYLKLGYQGPAAAREDANSSLSLRLARPTPILMAPPSAPSLLDALAPAAPSETRAVASSLAEATEAKGKQRSEDERAAHLLALRDQERLSPRDARGISLAIAAQAAAERVRVATDVVKQSLLELDVPDDIAKVFGEKPADYFSLVRAEHAFFDAVLHPRHPALNLLGQLERARAKHIEEPPNAVLRYEDSSQQKYVFIRFFEPKVERAGLVTLQQYVTEGPNKDGQSTTAWRVLDRYKFRSRGMRHLDDSITLGASRRLNRLQLRPEIRELLGNLRMLVREGSLRDESGAGRHVVLGHPPWVDARRPESPAPGGHSLVAPQPTSFATLSKQAGWLQQTDEPFREGFLERGRSSSSADVGKQATADWILSHRRNSSNHSSANASSVGSPRRSIDDDLIFTMSSPERQNTPPSPIDSQKTITVPPSPTTPRLLSESVEAAEAPARPMPAVRPASRAPVLKSSLRKPSGSSGAQQTRGRPAGPVRHVHLAPRPQVHEVPTSSAPAIPPARALPIRSAHAAGVSTGRANTTPSAGPTAPASTRAMVARHSLTGVRTRTPSQGRPGWR